MSVTMSRRSHPLTWMSVPHLSDRHNLSNWCSPQDRKARTWSVSAGLARSRPYLNRQESDIDCMSLVVCVALTMMPLRPRLPRSGRWPVRSAGRGRRDSQQAPTSTARTPHAQSSSSPAAPSTQTGRVLQRTTWAGRNARPRSLASLTTPGHWHVVFARRFRVISARLRPSLEHGRFDLLAGLVRVDGVAIDLDQPSPRRRCRRSQYAFARVWGGAAPLLIAALTGSPTP